MEKEESLEHIYDQLKDRVLYHMDKSIREDSLSSLIELLHVIILESKSKSNYHNLVMATLKIILGSIEEKGDSDFKELLFSNLLDKGKTYRAAPISDSSASIKEELGHWEVSYKDAAEPTKAMYSEQAYAYESDEEAGLIKVEGSISEDSYLQLSKLEEILDMPNKSHAISASISIGHEIYSHLSQNGTVLLNYEGGVAKEIKLKAKTNG